VLARAQGVPSGELTVSLPFALGSLLVRTLSRFTTHYPGVHINLRLTDRKARLVDDRIDVAIRVGPLNDSSLLSRKLCTTRWATVASPAYLAQRGRPETVAALQEHRCLRFRSPRGKPVAWTFKSTSAFTVDGALDVDQGEMLVEAALCGLGITQVFDRMVAAPLRDGRLQALLPDEAADGPAIYALCLRSQRKAPKVHAFIEFLLETFAHPQRIQRPREAPHLEHER